MTHADDQLDERQFTLAVRRLADALGYGVDASPFVGSGVDYAQSRPYVAGDPTRQMDWRVTARTGQPFVKEYEAHKRVPVYLLLDTSRSMWAASTRRSKHDWAVLLAGALALHALDGLHPVALFGCGDVAAGSDHHLRFCPSLSRSQVFQWMHRLRNLSSGGGHRTAVSTALGDVSASAAERSVVVVLSDLHEPAAPAAARRAAQRHDVVLLRLQDPAERGGIGGGIFRAAEAETGTRFVTTGRHRWLDAAGPAADLRRAGIDLITLDTGTDFVPALRQFLKTRRGSRGNR